MSKIQGMQYARPQTEHQYFPEDYFSGSDVTIYFDDIWVDEIVAMEFGLQESVMPIFGYGSYTWDSVSRGQRMVNGSFTIAFKEAGYVYRIFEHIAQLQHRSKPMLSYMMDEGGEKPPEWVAGVKQRMEDLIDKYHARPKEKEVVFKAPDFGDRILKYQDQSDQVKKLQEFIIDNGKPSRLQGLSPIPPINLTLTMKQNSANRSLKGYSNQVKVLQERLNLYLYDSGTKSMEKRLVVDGYFGPKTESRVKLFQTMYGQHLGRIRVDGIVGKVTRGLLNATVQATGQFDHVTKLSIMRFQQARGIPATGVVEEKTKEQFSISVDVNQKKNQYEADPNILRRNEDYEKRVWANQNLDGTSRGDRPHFYGTDKQIEWMPVDGFDIYINYGPLPESVIQNNGSLPDVINFNTTVRAIRNVQITGVQQMLSPDGTPIAERYTFIARDLD